MSSFRRKALRKSVATFRQMVSERVQMLGKQSVYDELLAEAAALAHELHVPEHKFGIAAVNAHTRVRRFLEQEDE